MSAVYIGIVGAKIKTTLKWLKSYITGELIEFMLNNYFPHKVLQILQIESTSSCFSSTFSLSNAFFFPFG